MGERRVIRACAKAARLTNRDGTRKYISRIIQPSLKTVIYFELEILLALQVARLKFYNPSKKERCKKK